MERKNLDLKIFENIRQIDNLKYMGEIGNTRRNWRYLQHCLGATCGKKCPRCGEDLWATHVTFKCPCFINVIVVSSFVVVSPQLEVFSEAGSTS